MQRLFSMFAGSWPGAGLALQRFVAAAALLLGEVPHLKITAQFMAIIAQVIGTGAGILLLVGLWTPVVGVVVAVGELWIAFSRSTDPWMALLLATLGGTLAMIGPGAWSIDARLFGRKRIETSADEPVGPSKDGASM